MGQIHLVRHGQASFGTADYDRLSVRGIEQARLLGRWFADCKMAVHCAVAGTMRRHAETAASFLAAREGQEPTSLQLERDAGFDEYDHHEILVRHDSAFAAQRSQGFGRQPAREFQALFAAAFERWVSGRHDGDYRINWPDFRARCVAALSRLAGRLGPGETAVVFTSGGAIAAICQALLQLPDAQVGPLQWQLVNASVTRLRTRPGQISLSSFNLIAHLERAADAGLITYR